MNNENNKMSPEQKFWLTIWLFGILGVLGLATIIAGGICFNNANAMKNGYERVVLPGSMGAQWQKAKTEK